MKAAVIKELHCIEIMELPMPEISDYEVLCKLKYGATCTGTDMHLLTGCPWNVKYPLIFGHESVGEVVELGRKARHYKTGDLVTRVGAPAYPEFGVSNGGGFGGFAEYGVGVDHWALKADNIQAQHKFNTRIHQVVPEFIDPREATMFITLRETLSYIQRLGAKPGDNILIVGSGANAFAFANHVEIMGLENIVMLGSKGREESAKKCGVTDFYDYRDREAPKKIREKYNGAHFDVIIDAVGESEQLRAVIPSLKNRGIIGIYGENEFRGASINPFAAPGTFTFYNEGYAEHEAHFEIIDYFRENKVNISAYLDINKPYPLENIGAAFEDIKNKRLRETKALIKL